MGFQHRIKFRAGAAVVQHTLSLTWKTDNLVWADQWPLNSEKLHQLNQLVEEQLQAGHIIPTMSPWNSPVFVIQKKTGKLCLLHDLQQINAVLQDMGTLQSGLPSPCMTPKNWHLTIIDLKG